MSFTVINNSNVLRYYSLPSDSGANGTYITSGGTANPCTWTPITSVPDRIYGEIVMWNGGIKVSSSKYQPVDSNNNVLADWYVCNTTVADNLNMMDRVMLGVDADITSLTSAGAETLKNIAYVEHSHGYEYIDSIQGYLVEGGSHTHVASGYNWSTIGGNDWNPSSSTKAKGEKKNSGSQYGALSLQALSSYTKIGYNGTGSHSHSFSQTCTAISKETHNPQGTTGNTYTRYKVHYIIYLPQVS